MGGSRGGVGAGDLPHGRVGRSEAGEGLERASVGRAIRVSWPSVKIAPGALLRSALTGC